MEVLSRIVSSQKVIVGVIAAISNAVASTMGYEVTEGVMLVANGIFGLLITIQGALDYKWGSKSDGTR